MPKRVGSIGIVLVLAIAAVLSIVATYALIRGYDVLFRREPNPATVIWSAKIAMFWRLNIGLYVAGMVAFGTAVAARRDLEKTIGVLFVAAHVVAAMIAIQGLVLP